jgi:hypothetical protein
MSVTETIQKLAELTSERRSLKECLKRQYEKFFLEPARPAGSSDEFISLTAGGWKALAVNTARLKSLIGTEGVKDLDDYFRFTAQL